MTEGMKKLLIPVAVILVCAIILTAASAGLAGTAASNAETELNEMISYLLPGGGEFEEIEYNGADSKITNVYKGEGGYVLAMTTNGYVDEIKLLVAVDNDGVVKGYTVRDIHDTYGLGLGVQDDLYFLVGLMNSKGDLAVNSNIDAVTGATISSSAVVACVNAASKYVQEAPVFGLRQVLRQIVPGKGKVPVQILLQLLQPGLALLVGRLGGGNAEGVVEVVVAA